MAQNGGPRRGSLVVPILLIAIGALFLYANWHPAFDPLPILLDWWPLLLIFIGLGKMYDSWQRREHPETPRSSVGTGIGAVIFVVVLVALFSSGRRWPGWHGGTVYAMQHAANSVDKQNAKSANVTIDLNAGHLDLSGGSSHLMEADFDYRSSAGAPKVDYRVSGTTGELEVSQEDSDRQFRTTTDNRWTLHFANDIPLEFKIDMGAGRANLRLQDIDATRIRIDIGAGQVDLDLTGDRKKDLNAEIDGGVGEANIRLPRNVGVIANATGGIGTVDAHGLRHDGDDYTNDAYGKTPATIHLKVEGGVGRISLRLE